MNPDGDVEHAREFCSLWSSLDAYEQEKQLAHVLEKVIYDADRKRIEVTFDRAKRQYKGQTIRVLVLPDGFEFEGER